MARRLRYHVAASLDGFIAAADGGYDWIVSDASIDFRALYRQFDTAIMGRKTFDAMKANGGDGSIPGLDVIVFSRTLQPVTRKAFRIVNGDPASVVADLKSRDGGDIWLFGGGALFRTLADAGLVDSVELAVIPVLLGEGIPLLPAGRSVQLVLGDHKVLPKSGIIALSYAVKGTNTPAPAIAYVKSP
jgi:dihydrofolate reductase